MRCLIKLTALLLAPLAAVCAAGKRSALWAERYSTTNLNTGLWKLVGGKASTGVSHVRKP